MEEEGEKYVWEGAIPLQINLHESEVTTLPPPPPVFILAPRLGYLPLLIPHFRRHFSDALPPGQDTIWFDYKGLPLKWYIPTGVLFDLLCAEPQRPWNLTVHFRGYPGNILIPCDSEDNVKWSFINSLKEAAYIINGNCKNIMNMSQYDQVELWRSVLSGNLEAYRKISSKLKLGSIEDQFTANFNSNSLKSRESMGDTETATPMRTGRIPVRLYVWNVSEDFNDLEDVPHIDNWDKISYINRPVDYQRREGKYFSLGDAVESLLPELFAVKQFTDQDKARIEVVDGQRLPVEDASNFKSCEDQGETLLEQVELQCPSHNGEIKLIRVQGIEPKLEIPFSWVVNNLMHPDHFVHICVCVKS